MPQRRGRRPSRRPGWRWRPGVPCSAVPSSSIILASSGTLLGGVHVAERVGDFAVYILHGFLRRPCPGSAARRHREVRRLRARRSKHRSARWRGPPCRSVSLTSASTVGLPRESRTSRPWISAIFDHVLLPCPYEDLCHGSWFVVDPDPWATGIETSVDVPSE